MKLDPYCVPGKPGGAPQPQSLRWERALFLQGDRSPSVRQNPQVSTMLGKGTGFRLGTSVHPVLLRGASGRVALGPLRAAGSWSVSHGAPLKPGGCVLGLWGHNPGEAHHSHLSPR